MARADQDVRWAQSPARSKVDEGNLPRLRAIVEEHGWPGRSLVGEDGADAAWLVSDRVAVFEGIHLYGRPGMQRFGTQVGSHTRDDGTRMEFPVDTAVEENRKAFLLPPRAQIDFEARPYPIPYGAARALQAWKWPRSHDAE